MLLVLVLMLMLSRLVGKNKMKNWKAAVRTWARKDQGGVRDEPEPTNSIRLW